LKEKLSVTVDTALVRFLDSLPGDSRSAKLERVLRGFRKVSKESALRHALAKVQEDDAERIEREAWIRTMEVDQWSESGEATSGRSTS
jgi:hypothetical protein